MSSNYSRSKIYYSPGDTDGTVTGTSEVTQTSEGELSFQPFEAYVQVTAEENVLTPAVISIGTNSPNYNNIVSGKAIGGQVGILPLQVQVNLPVIEPETDIKVKVNTACVAVPLTTPTLLFKVFVSGMDV